MTSSADSSFHLDFLSTSADWLDCLSESAERQISTGLKLYWQVSGTDGHSVGEREWLLVERTCQQWVLQQPINETRLANPSQGISNEPARPRWQFACQSCVCPLPDHRRGSAVTTVKATPHKSSSISSHINTWHAPESPLTSPPLSEQKNWRHVLIRKSISRDISIHT